MSRVSDSTGEIFPNIFSKLTCLVSSCEAAAQSDHTLWTTMIIGCVMYHIVLTIQTDPDVWREVNHTIASSIIGPPLGGLPATAVSLPALLRGVSDPLPLHIAATHAGTGERVPLKVTSPLTQILIPPSQRCTALTANRTFWNIQYCSH